MHSYFRLVINFINKHHSKILFLSFFFVIITYFIIRFFFVFSTNIGLEHGEEDNIWNALNVLHGKPMYTSPIQVPYEIYLYPPVSQLINVLVLKVFQVNSIYTTSIILRIISLIYNFFTSWLVHKELKKNNTLEKSFLPFWISFLLLITLIHLNWTIRVDALSILVLTFTFLFFVNHFQELTIFKEIKLAICICIATFIKQDGIQFVVIFPFILILFSKVLSAFRIFLFSITLIFLFFGVFYLIYGPSFIESVVGGVDNPISIRNGFLVINRYFQTYSILPVFSLALMIFSVVSIHVLKIKVLSLIGVGTFIFACLTSIKLGAWINYFSLFTIVSLVLIGRFLILNSKYFTFFKITSLLFSVYYLSGVVFHYLTPEFNLDKSNLFRLKDIAEHVSKTIPKNSYVYTDNDVLELYLHDKTIFPNQVFYPDMNQFEHQINNHLYSCLYVISKNNNRYDVVINNLLSLKKKDLILVQKYSGYNLYKIQRSI